MQFTHEASTIAYELDGQGRELLVFVPALGANSAMWTRQVDGFTSAYTVVTYDAGHVDPASTGSLTGLPQAARELAALLDAVGAINAHIVGLSLGGMIA